ncbi:mechanosensitive ion channel family protein [Pseudovibrio sp. SPO723]|uniref:mechanosensitive ion channel family protein n=1 Tax=Nesiotobacter zosterae TaxID=392721 RepID=UPI0029C21AB1|nr:mechanosensitive ion channel family protein [Pseudovibrio sp. SPO723]MDX5593984.1 mechanosensitive ion channel family protein [Pseudovibrio sp. SPO723]
MTKIRAFAFLVLFVLAPLNSVWGAKAQFVGAATPEAAQAVELPTTLSPEDVDSLLARLTDAQIRELLRSELARRAQETSEVGPEGPGALDAAAVRLNAMYAEIAERLPRWSVAIANIDDRLPQVRERLGLAQYGVAAMVGAAFLLVAVGVGAAIVVSRALAPARAFLSRPPDLIGYWSRLGRTVALGVLELLPVGAFVLATRAAGGFLGEALGPLEGVVWIYHAGVSTGGGFLILVRRVFSPDLHEIRIARLSDDDATALYHLLKTATYIAVSGWLLAGFFPNLGFGFPPALVTVALTGTVVAVLLAKALFSNRVYIAQRVQELLSGQAGPPGAVAYSVPAIAGLYLLVSWLYWLAHWLERGQHELAGPIGGLFALLALPVADRAGIEMIGGAVRSDSDTADRLRHVMLGAWRSLITVVAIYVIVRLWGLDLLVFAKGPGAPVWASTLFDITLTLLLGYLAWRLIRAALHREEQAGDGGEDGDPMAPAASRLSTLTPLFRSILLVILTVVVTMIILSSIGVDIGPLLASAGIVGIAIGFGAQTLVRDVFSGIVFLIDDAFRIGEYIELDQGVRGAVEWISFRSLILRHHRGPVITIPFGEMKMVTNHTRDWVIYKMSFRLEPDTDPKVVKKIVKAVGQEFLEDPEHGPKFIEPLKSQGVLSIDDDSALIIRVKFKCYPKTQFVLRREIYHRLREVFAESGIKFARKKVEVIGSSPIEAAAAEAVLADQTAATAKQGDIR